MILSILKYMSYRLITEVQVSMTPSNIKKRMDLVTGGIVFMRLSNIRVFYNYNQMSNNRIASRPPPSLLSNNLPKNKKIQIMTKVLSTQIDTELHKNKIYQRELQILMMRRQNLQNKFIVWEEQNLGMEQSWNYSRYQHNKGSNIKKQMGESNMAQSIAFNISSPPKKGDKSSSNKSIQKSPFLKLSPTKVSESQRKVELHFDKIQEIRQEIKQIQARIRAKEKKFQGKQSSKDEISQNLFIKISQEESKLENLLKQWQKQQKKNQHRKKLKKQIANLQEKIFKEKQGLTLMKDRKKCLNKDIIRNGYTQKMKKIIQSYQGNHR